MAKLSIKQEQKINEMTLQYKTFVSKFFGCDFHDDKFLLVKRYLLAKHMENVKDVSQAGLAVIVVYRINKSPRGVAYSTSPRDIKDVVKNGIELPDNVTFIDVKVIPYFYADKVVKFVDSCNLFDRKINVVTEEQMDRLDKITSGKERRTKNDLDVGDNFVFTTENIEELGIIKLVKREKVL